MTTVGEEVRGVGTSARLGLEPGRGPVSLAEHQAVHGAMPFDDPADLLAEVAASGLTGRGGAGFPVHRKMAGVLAGPGPRVVVANAAEGEPASAKDKTLLARNPHLTLDGLQLAAHVVGASSAYIYVHHSAALRSAVARAVEERRRAGLDRVPVEIAVAPPLFVAGEESAVVSKLSGGPARPRPKPPRVFESGVYGRPTLVQNAETLAHVALVARYGAAEFRRVGAEDQPGTMLFTVTGAVHHPGVVEAPVGTSFDAVLAAAGGLAQHAGAVLFGGYHGAWHPWPAARELVLSNAALRPHGLSVGAGVLVVLPAGTCGIRESVRILDYLARESAGQCGPCVFGLPALATTFREVAGGRSGRRHQRRLHQLASALEQRGGCHHPDGTVRFVRSAINVFGDELAAHARGFCTALDGA